MNMRDLQQERLRLLARMDATREPAQAGATVHEVEWGVGSNPLRPTSFKDLIGQERAKANLLQYIASAEARGSVLDHVLLVGASGLGKTTLAVCIADALGGRLFQVQAPVSFDTLISLKDSMHRGDVLFVDEIHMQAIQERRGRESITQPEVFFNVLEDRTIVTPSGVEPFPEITVIGATTDEGMLPDPFINRFPIRPPLVPYTDAELLEIARYNTHALGVEIADSAAAWLVDACRGVPRVLNNYVRNAVGLLPEGGRIDAATVVDVLDMNGVSDDGLTADMQKMLTFLRTRAKHVRQDGETIYSASLSTLATALGKSRDSKAIVLRVEPYLIERGYIGVGPRGRYLTDAGITRANELLENH